MSFISPTFTLSGYLSSRTFEGNSAISENHSKSKPKGSHATDAASIPEHTLPTVFIFIESSLKL